MRALVLILALFITGQASISHAKRLTAQCQERRDLEGLRQFLSTKFNSKRIELEGATFSKLDIDNLNTLLKDVFPNNPRQRESLRQRIVQHGWDNVQPRFKELRPPPSGSYSNVFENFVQAKKIHFPTINRYLDELGLEDIAYQKSSQFDHTVKYRFASKEKGNDVVYEVWSHTPDKKPKIRAYRSGQIPTIRITREVPVDNPAKGQPKFKTEHLDENGKWRVEPKEPIRSDFQTETDFKVAKDAFEEKFNIFSHATHIPSKDFGLGAKAIH